MKFDARLLKQLNSVRGWFALTMVCGLLVGGLTIVQARLLSAIIAPVFLQNASLDAVRNLLLAGLAIIGGRALLSWLGDVSAFQIAARIKSDLRMRVFNRLLELGPAYVRRERTGELVHTLTEGIEALDAYVSQYLPQLVLAALVPLAILVFVFPIDWLSAIVLLFTGPLIPLFMMLIGSAAEALTRKQYAQLSLLSAHFIDVLQGLATLKMFGRSRAQIETIARVSHQFRDATMNVLRVAFLSAFALEMIATLSTAIVAVQVGLRLLYGQLEFESALFVLVLAPDFYLPLRLLGTRFHAGMNGVAAAARMFEILETEDKGRRIKALPLSSVLCSPSIAFHDVHYAYADQPALTGISFTIEPGQRVALMGATGAGKSTLVNLLLRFSEPTRGEIYWGDTPMRAVSPVEWRKHIAWVPQLPYLFNDSIANNIRLARPAASLDEVRRAAELAHADEFIARLPQGYATLIGERGARLSAGQAQRIALARAFLKDAPFLILDEATAHLDIENEMLIQDAIENLLRGKTALIVTHRPSTATRADKIVVLHAGRIRDQRSVVSHPPSAVSRQRSVVSRQSSAVSHPLNLPTHPASRFTFYALLRLAAPFKLGIALAILLGAFTIGSSIGLMATSAYIIASAALHPSIADLAVPIVGVRFFGIARGVFRYLERYVSHHINFNLLARLRVWFYTAIEPLAPAKLQTHRSGDLLARIVGDIETLQNFYVRIIAPPMVALVITVAVFIFLAGLAPRLALTTIAFMILVGIGVPMIVHHIGKSTNRQTIHLRSALYAQLVDGIQGIADLIAYGREQTQTHLIADLNRRWIRAQQKMAMLAGAHNAAGNFLTHLAMWCVLWLAIPMVNTAQFAGVYLPVIALAVLASFEGVLALPAAFQYLETNLAAARRLFEFIAHQPPTADYRPRQSIVVRRPPSSIVFQNVSLCYDANEPPAIDNLSFELPAGKTVAIVGASGAGKTSIVNVLMRFWDYTGKILIDGCELRELAPETAREFFGVVAQPIHLFNATIRDNLLLARPDATEEEIIDAARRAEIHNFIAALPAGYHTRIGEQGLRLSGGERQRLAIARALLKRAPILIFDEATSHLDPATARAVWRNLRQTQATMLIITHRLDELANVDEILLLRAGKIIQRGTPAELMRAHGDYRRMWELQTNGGNDADD